jgi:hypothetical protein
MAVLFRFTEPDRVDSQIAGAMTRDNEPVCLAGPEETCPKSKAVSADSHELPSVTLSDTNRS